MCSWTSAMFWQHKKMFSGTPREWQKSNRERQKKANRWRGVWVPWGVAVYGLGWRESNKKRLKKRKRWREKKRVQKNISEQHFFVWLTHLLLIIQTQQDCGGPLHNGRHKEKCSGRHRPVMLPFWMASFSRSCLTWSLEIKELPLRCSLTFCVWG